MNKNICLVWLVLEIVLDIENVDYDNTLYSNKKNNTGITLYGTASMYAFTKVVH
jgi:hypothetical protein